MHSIEVILMMLLAVAASGYVGRMLPVPLPLPLVQIGFGAAIAQVSGEGVVLDPQVFFLLFLPPLLFLDGWRIPKEGLFRDKGIILALAFGLVVFTVLGMGLLINLLIPAMPLPVAFALAAIVSPTDPVAVSAITARSPIPKRLMHILEGESLLNDASGLVCFRFAVAAVATGAFSLASAAMTFVWVAVIGVAAGVGFTMAVSLAQRWLSRHLGEDAGAPVLISLLIPFGAYLVAEVLQASGILAAVAAGITMSYVELTGRALASTRLSRAAVWDAVQFTLNGIMFVLLGEQLPSILKASAITVAQSGHDHVGWLPFYAFVIIIGLGVLRFAWVWLGLLGLRWLAERRGHPQPLVVHWRLIVATSLAGVRGAITLAGVMTLPLTLADGSAFPARDLAIFLAMAVILFSLVVASIGLPHVLRGLETPALASALQDEDMARHEAATAAIEAVERARQAMAPDDAGEVDLITRAAARVVAAYQYRLRDQTPDDVDAALLRRGDAAEKALRLAGLQAERETVYGLARRNLISDDLSRRLVREIDLMESRYQA